MDFLKSMTIAASGLRAQAGRMRIIAENIANADSTSPSSGADPYRRKTITLGKFHGITVRRECRSGCYRPVADARSASGRIQS